MAGDVNESSTSAGCMQQRHTIATTQEMPAASSDGRRELPFGSNCPSPVPRLCNAHRGTMHQQKQRSHVGCGRTILERGARAE